MKRTLVFRIKGKAKHVWQLLSLLSRDFGDVTIGEIVAERGQ
jgi:hypothetical protein